MLLGICACSWTSLSFLHLRLGFFCAWLALLWRLCPCRCCNAACRRFCFWLYGYSTMQKIRLCFLIVCTRRTSMCSADYENAGKPNTIVRPDLSTLAPKIGVHFYFPRISDMFFSPDFFSDDLLFFFLRSLFERDRNYEGGPNLRT